jgi:hypothetical protein
VDSMGRRNTSSKPKALEFQRLNSFANADSKKTPPCLGVIEDSLGDGFVSQTIMGPTD